MYISTAKAFEIRCNVDMRIVIPETEKCCGAIDIKIFEGFMPTTYKCNAGYRTIGYGHKLKKNENFNGITISEAEELLKRDLYEVCKGINRMTHVQLLQKQYDSIESFVFNVGLGAYQRSTLRSRINRGEHELVPKEIKKWIYIGVQKSKGLSRRRNIDAAMYS